MENGESRDKESSNPVLTDLQSVINDLYSKIGALTEERNQWVKEKAALENSDSQIPRQAIDNTLSNAEVVGQQPLEQHGIGASTPNLNLVSTLPVFSGSVGEHAHEFFDAIDSAATLSNWSDGAKLEIAKLRLRGQAANYVKVANVRESTKDYQSLRRELIGRFEEKLPTCYFFEQLAQVRQKPGESIIDFSDRVQRIADKTIRITANAEVNAALRQEGDRRALDAFTRGLHGKLGDLTKVKFPETFKEAVTIALALESMNRRPTDDNVKKVFTAERKNLTRCYHCGKLGHIQRYCRSKQTGPPRKYGNQAQTRRHDWGNKGGKPPRKSDNHHGERMNQPPDPNGPGASRSGAETPRTN